MHARGQGDLDVGGHCLVALAEVAGLLRFFDHGGNTLDGLLAFLETAGYLLCEGFNFALFLGFYVFVVEAGEDVFGVEFLKLGGFEGDVFEHFVDFFLYVDPARGKKVHLDDCVAVFVGASGHETAGLVGGGCGEAIGAFVGGREAAAFGGVVGVGLAIGDVAVKCVSK